MADEFDGIFISNGPGNPKQAAETVKNLRFAMQTYEKPIFGICMGNLLLGMAAGLDVYKLRFGNRGHNVPALNMKTGKCAITSQNHGKYFCPHTYMFVYILIFISMDLKIKQIKLNLIYFLIFFRICP